MAKVFKEEQAFRDRPTIAAIVAIILLTSYGILSPFISGSGIFPVQNLLLFLISVAIFVFVVWRLRMRISISKKKIKVRMSHIPWKRFEHHRDEVDQIEFFKINEAIISSGLVVHFGDKTKTYYFGDRAGMIIQLSNGQTQVVFSDKLFLDRERITRTLEANGWKVKSQLDEMVAS